ncbi:MULTISPECIES: hypothetical protein [Streptomyces]|uniref:hypothetical protein n=1 Tax=Streptomyces TaxID=1883 RepID=UPI000565DB00|nr:MULTISPECIES: hypothetical protein [Streptomyces]AOW86738.1 hypothetical protein BC342_09405 [Streptomyces olivaceus]MBZ6112099.1 hypothetical protein [Streptomyces olivaceus]MBZ6125445.1 hypothetical protein [Streptomyces olivaceus]MBZ6146435.1 hypothetical protein [Streptomyces olivaceus]MBZ6160564.1 hypothetical protein [Streptomyces olivaceus]
MSSGDDRIWFLGNPWPDGHRIVEFEWDGWLDPDIGLRFTFELESADYNADDPPELEDDDDGDDEWGSSFESSKVVWRNYHRCSIRPAMGFVVGTPDEPLDFEVLASRTFRVDRPEDVAQLDDEDDLAFHIYLLGHDSVADHHIRFPATHAPFEFGLEWVGRIALTYIGDEEFKHRFQVRVGRATFRGFQVPDELDDEAADRLLTACVRDAARFRLSRDGGERRYVPVS